MKTATIPQVRVEPALRAELDAVLGENETLSEFVESAVRRAVEYRRVQAAFLDRGEQAWLEFQRTGQAVEADAVLAKLQGRLDQRRRKLRQR
jgi:predicted transcriptional regulator